LGWQIYVQTEVKKSEDMLTRINKLDVPVPGKREDDERSKDIVEDRESDIKDAGGGIGQSLFFGTDPTLTWKKTLP
jgi:hypothetical protein